MRVRGGEEAATIAAHAHTLYNTHMTVRITNPNTGANVAETTTNTMATTYTTSVTIVTTTYDY